MKNEVVLKTALLFAVLQISVGFIHGQEKLEEIYEVPRSDGEMQVDGLLKEKLWRGALVLQLKYETYPGDNTPATYRTEVLLCYSREALLVGIRCYDSEPGAIRARLTDRDSDPGDDYFGIVLDTFNDQRSAYFFWTNPLGVQEDSRMLNNETDRGWDAIYESAGMIADWGWSAEMKIPFNSISFQPSDEPQTWGFDAYRIVPRTVARTLNFAPRDRSNNCELCQLVKLRGFKGVSPGRNIEITPTVTGISSDVKHDFPVGELANEKRELESGITATWGVTNNSELAMTFNPDFSQVEADSYQLDLNEPFALFYIEKRPFFTEGADYFSTPFDVVYTRSIRDPGWGAKYTGKDGKNSFAAFILEDEVTNLIFPGNRGSSATSLDLSSRIITLRFKRDIGENSSLGMIYTGREGDEYFNRVLGFDGNIFLSRTDKIGIQLLASSTAYPEAIAAAFDQSSEAIAGRAAYLSYSHSTRTWGWRMRYEDVDSDFRADLGYMPRNNYRYHINQLDYKFWGNEKTWWDIIFFAAGSNFYFDQDGDLLQGTGLLAVIVQGAMSSASEFVYARRKDHYSGQEFDLNIYQFSGSIVPVSQVSLSCESTIGDTIDYTHARGAKITSLIPEITYLPNSRLSLRLQHNFQRLDADDAHLFTANISELNLSYQISLRAKFRAILQKVHYRFNQDNYAFPLDPVVDEFFSQFLFSYTLNPRTVLYLGYSDNYLGTQDFNLSQLDRTFFLKLSYAWQL